MKMPITNLKNWIAQESIIDMVSVIIPTFNRGGLLKEAIQSVFDQTYRPIECIIIDDGSTDHTFETVSCFVKNNTADFSVLYLYQPNEGSQAAKNKGTIVSKGEFIQYLDSDDLLYPEKIEKQVNYLKQNKDCGGVFGDWDKGLPHKCEHIKAFARPDLILQFLGELCIPNFGFLMRRELVAKIGLWDVNIKRNQEVDYHLRGLLAGGKYNYQELTCGLWRIHSGERIATTTGKKEVMNFLIKWENTLSIHKQFTSERKLAIANSYFWFAMQNNTSVVDIVVEMLRRAWILNPKLAYFSTPKMKMAKSFLGYRNALKIWLLIYQRNKFLA